MTIEQHTPASIAASRVSRRGFLGGTAGAIGAGLVLAACGDDGGTTSGATSTAAMGAAGTSPATTVTGANDTKIATLAAGLEVLAVATYKAALDAAGAGKIGTVPPAVATFATTARDQHQK